MPAHELMESPVWKPEQLGAAIPASRHAVSVALPRWQDVVGYEEKNNEVMKRLLTGYPRFVIHPLVQKLSELAGNGDACLPFPSARSAELAAKFVRQTTGVEPRVQTGQGVHSVFAEGNGHTALRTFWQHTGLIVSSRQAEACLEGKTDADDAEAVRRSLRQQLAGFYHCSEDDVFLKPTGMAGLFAALEAVMIRAPQRATAQLGFPYVDTLKLQQKFGHTGILLHHLNDLDARLGKLLERERLAGCFCEIPGNPLLGSADLRRVSPLLREHRVPLVVDDVVATPFNIDVSPYADLVATSLTKFIVGTGDAMGGALVCNPRSPLYEELKAIIHGQHEELLWGEDARVLNDNAKTFQERMRRHNENGLILAERLRAHPNVERVWYPKWESNEAYEGVRRPDGGWGALITFLPKNAAANSPAIYDRLSFCKGPSLGTMFTLACPFTILAHYTELEWAEACGVSRYLLRISVGLEEPEDLWRRLNAALSASRAG